MLRGRSKEAKDRDRKVTPPGPVYMSNDQFADYLANLRNTRVARPSGARPQPASIRRDSEKVAPTKTQRPDSPERSSTEYAPRSASAMSHRRAQSALSNYSSTTSRTGRQLVQQPDVSKPLKPSEVVPTATYIERGQRWMEKEEAVSLREAMEDMELSKEEEEEARIHGAAQNEASELVYQHQNPQAAIHPEAPYRYNDHLRKNSYQHARTQSVGRYGGMGIVTGLARDIPPRSVSGGSSSSGGMPISRVSSGSSNGSGSGGYTNTETRVRHSLDQPRADTVPKPNQKSYGSVSNGSKPPGSSRRRISVKRNISGEMVGSFSGEQIWEEPEDVTPRGRAQKDEVAPAPLRIKPRNPLNRVQFAQDLGVRSSSTPPEQTKKLSRTEIYRNPPTQSRNPLYTANPIPAIKAPEQKAVQGEEPASGTPTKDGLEIRSDDIRQATSMRLKDRSPKLPTPTIVSDKPGRPIVSFDKSWKPKEADDKPEVRRRTPFDRDRGTFGSQRQSLPTRSDSKDVSSPGPSPNPIPSILQVKAPPAKSDPTINLPVSQPSVPTINLPDSRPAVPAAVPTINLPDSTPSVPTINFPDAPEISVSAPEVPTINVSSSTSTTPKSNGQRPLPDPKTAASKPRPQNFGAVPTPRGHWSPAAAGKRATATCHQCQLPIEGRVLNLRGNSQHFHPQCFICFTCGTGLESLEIRCEPDTHRGERIDRIKRRAQGENLPEIEGQTLAEDGDERMRFYCHLDWHENFAPKCKHCKTPIIGECTVALGEHWHYGHFFCAECGDPFEKGQTHIEKDGYAWCLNCQTKRTERQAPKCKKCKQPVIGQYIQAMGGEWHDKCFRCHECHTGFSDGSFYPRDVGGEMHVLCIGCLEKKLKA
ncbi:Paxillin [Lachnellula arida]|uniref:Paxillin n=1 Tax=Lachnellula arida TaxID=1316785 RepID=A0A8T9B3H8_9HELO|nr:Paxillin [Lachnellula arida]